MKKHSVRVVVFEAVVVVIVGIGTIAGAFWANDVRQDRKHIVFVDSQTPIFGGSGERCGTDKPIALIQPGAVLRVRRVRYWKDCATIYVKAPNGRHDYLVLDEKVSISPPLN